MISNSTIPLFREIPDLYAAARLQRSPRSTGIDVLALKAEPAARPAAHTIGPHRRGFFQLTYLLCDDGGRDALLASSPEQVLNSADYLRATLEHQHGFTLLFKAEALAHQLASPTNEFPFFCLPASLELPLSSDLREKLLPQFRAVERAADDDGPYRVQRLSALTAALLYDVRTLYERAEATPGEHRLCTQLVCRFDEIVLQHFPTHHTVEDYARLLHVSADHLSAEVKARTGRNAREIIAERLIAEAKHLLTYTDLQAGQIADQLGFSEATHFTRFFRRHVQESPSAFRRRIYRSPTDRVGSSAADAGNAMAV